MSRSCMLQLCCKYLMSLWSTHICKTEFKTFLHPRIYKHTHAHKAFHRGPTQSPQCALLNGHRASSKDFALEVPPWLCNCMSFWLSRYKPWGQELRYRRPSSNVSFFYWCTARLIYPVLNSTKLFSLCLQAVCTSYSHWSMHLLPYSELPRNEKILLLSLRTCDPLCLVLQIALAMSQRVASPLRC